MITTDILVEWTNGEVEVIDTADSESEAINLVNEYRTVYNAESYKRIWMQLSRS